MPLIDSVADIVALQLAPTHLELKTACSVDVSGTVLFVQLPAEAQVLSPAAPVQVMPADVPHDTSPFTTAVVKDKVPAPQINIPDVSTVNTSAAVKLKVDIFNVPDVIVISWPAVLNKALDANVAVPLALLTVKVPEGTVAPVPTVTLCAAVPVKVTAAEPPKESTPIE